MRVRLQRESVLITTPEELDKVESIVVYDDFDQPIIVVQKIADGTVYSSKASDPEFPGVLRALGIGLNNPSRVIGP
jgi:hypothetical protein